MAKKQTELKGFKRPTIDAVDKAGAEHLESLEREKAAKEEVTMSGSVLLAALADNVKKLTKDSDGNFVYKYNDGENSATFKLVNKKSLKTKTEKKVPDEDEEPTKAKAKAKPSSKAKTKAKPKTKEVSKKKPAEPSGDIG